MDTLSITVTDPMHQDAYHQNVRKEEMAKHLRLTERVNRRYERLLQKQIKLNKKVEIVKAQLDMQLQILRRI